MYMKACKRTGHCAQCSDVTDNIYMRISTYKLRGDLGRQRRRKSDWSLLQARSIRTNTASIARRVLQFFLHFGLPFSEKKKMRKKKHAKTNKKMLETNESRFNSNCCCPFLNESHECYNRQRKTHIIFEHFIE